MGNVNQCLKEKTDQRKQKTKYITLPNIKYTTNLDKKFLFLILLYLFIYTHTRTHVNIAKSHQILKMEVVIGWTTAGQSAQLPSSNFPSSIENKTFIVYYIMVWYDWYVHN